MGDSKLKSKPKLRQRRCLNHLTALAGVCLAVYCLLFLAHSPHVYSGGTSSAGFESSTKKLAPELLNNLSLDEDECRAVFPGLTQQVDHAVVKGPFALKKPSGVGPLSPLLGRIKDGRLYIIQAQRRKDLSKDMHQARIAALNQLHRALLTSPSSLPNTIFTLNTQDSPISTALQYSRQADPLLAPKDPNARAFLIPHFSFWAWPLPFIGSLPRASAAIDALEAKYLSSWRSKNPRPVWRGTAWYNSAYSPGLRQKLLQVAKDKSWADVQTLNWTTAPGEEGKSASNALMIEDFCRYKYIIHTEGVSYSGRFLFHQMCKSVVIAPPIQWMMHTSHLVKPVFSGRLLGKGKGKWMPKEVARRVWGEGYAPEEANIVFVERDWSDLEDTVKWFEGNQRVAEGIATRQREVFNDGGYHSPAAEMCHWRAVIRGWAETVRTEGQEWEEAKGISWEEFSLKGDMG